MICKAKRVGVVTITKIRSSVLSTMTIKGHQFFIFYIFIFFTKRSLVFNFIFYFLFFIY